ncbi:MAG: TVP38/TMEM64 family protein, partial [Gemmatimonadota bacterium]
MPEQTIRFKRKTFIAWLLFVAVVLALYLTYQDRIDVEWMRGVVHDNRFLIVPFYLLLLSALGLAFIPSTPFAIAGVFLFDPTAAYFLNLLGILTSSTIVYHFAGFLGLSTVFEAKYPERTEKVRAALDHKELPI